MRNVNEKKRLQVNNPGTHKKLKLKRLKEAEKKKIQTETKGKV